MVSIFSVFIIFTSIINLTQALEAVKASLKPVKDKRLVEGLVGRLVENQQKMLHFIKDNPLISKKEMAEKLGISTTAIDKNINQLKKKGLLLRVGPDKGGHWETIGGQTGQ